MTSELLYAPSYHSLILDNMRHVNSMGSCRMIANIQLRNAASLNAGFGTIF